MSDYYVHDKFHAKQEEECCPFCKIDKLQKEIERLKGLLGAHCGPGTSSMKTAQEYAAEWRKEHERQADEIKWFRDGLKERLGPLDKALENALSYKGVPIEWDKP